MNTAIPYPHATAVQGQRLIASGPLDTVALLAKVVADRPESQPVNVFEDSTGQLLEIDFRGSAQEVMERLSARFAPARPAPGRPRLGVVAREVTLLPRHWDWLATQPGGASVALRKLVEAASRGSQQQDQRRAAQEACYRFMSTTAGNLPGFEEAARALFAGDALKFAAEIKGWPSDLRGHILKLAGFAA